MDLNHECAVRINGVGGSGARAVDPRMFEETTGIPCAELAVAEDGDALVRPVAADWSPREFGSRFFPEDDVDAGDIGR